MCQEEPVPSHLHRGRVLKILEHPIGKCRRRLSYGLCTALIFSWTMENRRIEVEIHMPCSAKVIVQNGNGRVRERSDGQLNFTTADRRLELEDLGGILRAHSGDVSVSVSGRFDVHDCARATTGSKTPAAGRNFASLGLFASRMGLAGSTFSTTWQPTPRCTPTTTVLQPTSHRRERHLQPSQRKTAAEAI